MFPKCISVYIRLYLTEMKWFIDFRHALINYVIVSLIETD